VFFHTHELLNEQRNVVAEDFAYSLGRILDPEVASPGLWLFDKLDADNPFAVIDKHTFSITLNQAFPPFLGLLTMPYCSVVPQEVVEHYGADFRANPVGTGPFKMNFWYEGSRLSLLKNQRFFQKSDSGEQLPYLDAVSVSFVRDRTTQFLDFLKGEYDMMSGLYNEYKNELLTSNGTLSPAYADRFVLLQEPYLKTDYLGIIVSDEEVNEDSALKNKLVRQAINAAIDRKSMVKFIKNNASTAAESGFLPPSCLNDEADKSARIVYDKDKARRLLDQAGYPNGRGVEPIVLSTTSGYVELCEFVQHQLSQIGLNVSVDVLPTSSHREGVSQARVEFFRKSWIADYSDGENFLALFYGPNAAPRGSNYTRFNNARYDSLYEASQQLTVLKDRQVLYREMNDIITDEAPVIPLFYDKVMRFVRKDVQGIKSNAMNQLFLKEVRIERDL
jgi:peptide/nickel transport system substrate-binding protein